jgi:hypothetical protein
MHAMAARLNEPSNGSSTSRTVLGFRQESALEDGIGIYTFAEWTEQESALEDGIGIYTFAPLEAFACVVINGIPLGLPLSYRLTL